MERIRRDDNRFTWVIKDFSSVQSNFIESDEFVVGGCKWFLKAFPKGIYGSECLSLYLVAACYRALPCGWRRHAKYRFTVVNQLSDKLSQRQAESQHWFEQQRTSRGFPKMLPLAKLHDKEGGFLVSNEVKILVEIDVLEVIGNLDFSVECQEATQPLKRTKLNDDGVVSSLLHKETSPVKQSIDVNGFQVPPSQAEYVKRIFEKHPNMAIDFRAKNQNLRTSIINALLNLVDTLCQSLQDLSIDDLGQADNALTYLKISGFKVDWLEHRMEEVKKRKIEEEISETRMQELEEELKDIKALLKKKKEEVKDLKKKCSDTEALLKKEKAKVLAARVPPLTLSDVL